MPIDTNLIKKLLSSKHTDKSKIEETLPSKSIVSASNVKSKPSKAAPTSESHRYIPLEGVEIKLPDLSQTPINDNFDKDMAILFAFFNPMKSKRILMNYLMVSNYYKGQGIPTFTIELVFNDETPEIQDAMHVRSKSYMFYKEHLLRVLETKIPKQFTKLAFLDADVLFDNVNWYSSASKMLEEYDVIQPFEKAVWLDITYTKPQLIKYTWLKQESCVEKVTWNYYHPGFAWCMRRDWYNKVGFFDKGFANAGDTYSAIFWKQIKPTIVRLPNALLNSYSKYCQNPLPKMSYLENVTLYHLFHGTLINRQHGNTYKLIDVDTDIDDLTFLNDDGIYEWKDPAINERLREYFVLRDDDGI